SSSYYGFHAGIGRVFNLTDSTSLDLFGKWLYTRQGAKSLTIQDTHPLKFDAISSSRLRVGFRVSTQVSGYIRPYVGLAYERELDGKAKATVNGIAIGVPELKGGTGIGEAGLTISAAEHLTLDLGVRGYAGQRQGVTGFLNLTVNF
ncbi:MAG: autotransporter domain-containing protein, partial [Deltaproteobacteria bacterium]|nr:autotransporter domain-containing protein [Deltaproteobacteria bacterium]